VILIFIFVNYNLQGPTENRQGEWVPWINIIIITIIAEKFWTGPEIESVLKEPIPALHCYGKFSTNHTW